jgi:hypothetical protein
MAKVHFEIRPDLLIVVVHFSTLPQGFGFSASKPTPWGTVVTVDPERVDSEMLSVVVQHEVGHAMARLNR